MLPFVVTSLQLNTMLFRWLHVLSRSWNSGWRTGHGLPRWASQSNCPRQREYGHKRTFSSLARNLIVSMLLLAYGTFTEQRTLELQTSFLRSRTTYQSLQTSYGETSLIRL